MSMLSTNELERLSAAESLRGLQTKKQREFETRVKEMGARMAKRLGMSRRRFFQTAAGMATAFLAMNDTYGPIFGVSAAEAAEPEHADDRAKKLSGQFIMDMHTHFLRPGTKIMTFVNQRKAVGKAGWNPGLGNKEQSIDDLMFTNYLKEIYLDSDTKVACISGAPSEVPEDWFLTNEMKAQARADVNGLAGSKRMLAHA
ncbi:MAG: amidohydrolase, partial [Betaproteobacteria bacterium]